VDFSIKKIFGTCVSGEAYRPVNNFFRFPNKFAVLQKQVFLELAPTPPPPPPPPPPPFNPILFFLFLLFLPYFLFFLVSERLFLFVG